MKEASINLFAFLPNWLKIMIITAITVVELRGVIPVAILGYYMPYFHWHWALRLRVSL